MRPKYHRSSDWGEYKKWSFSLLRDVLAHIPYILRILFSFPKKALEIGCGTGLHGCFISYFGVDTVLVDVSPKVIKIASYLSRHYKAQNVNFVVADARYLPFRSGSFDLCFSQGLLEHFDDDTIRAIALETGRVSRRMIFSVPSINYPRRDFGDERLLTPLQWSYLLSNPRAKLRYYRLDLQSIKNSLLSRRAPKPWHILIEISSSDDRR